MKIVFLILGAALAFSQADVRRTIIPGQANTDTGILGFRELNGSGSHEVQISSPNALAATYRLRWPVALPAVNGECFKGTTAGVTSWGPCGTIPAAAAYDWIQTITAPGAAGTKTITLTPGPLGVRATDTASQYWMIGTAGASEQVVSTGIGTCNGTALASCTIDVVTANSHTGTTTIQSATAGAQEAWNVLSAAACPSIALGPGLRQFYGSLRINDCVTVFGDPDGTTAIHANDVNSPAISIVYAGSNGRTAYVAGRISISSIGTHTTGSASVLIEGYTDGGVNGVYCFNPYRCLDWYANNSGGGNPLLITDIRSSGTINTAIYMHAATVGQTAGTISHIYVDGIASTGIRIVGQVAGWAISNLWLQLLSVGISLEEVGVGTINEISVSGPCIIDGAQSAAVNINAVSATGGNGILIHGCWLVMDSGGIPIVASGMERLSIKNNWIRQSGANYGISLSKTNFSEVSGNTINFENTAGTAYGIGLVTTASTDVRVADNVIRRISGAGSATGLVFQALAYSNVDYCDNRFYGLTTDIANASTGGGVTSCKYGAAATPLTLTQSGSGYTQPLTLRNEAIGANGTCIGLSATDTASSTVHTIGRLCSKFETASFTDELVTIQTATGPGTFADAVSIKNQVVTLPGTLVVSTAASIAALTMAGSQTPGLDGLGNVGTTGVRYGSMAMYNLNAGGAAGIITFLPGAAPAIGHVWTAASTAGVGGWAAPAAPATPLTLRYDTGSPYSEPLVLSNEAIGTNGVCLALRATDTAGPIYTIGRFCAKFETALFTDELVTIQTLTGSGTYADAISIKNQVVTFPGSIIAGAGSVISSLTMAGTMQPGFDGLGSIGTNSVKYGAMHAYMYTGSGNATAVTPPTGTLLHLVGADATLPRLLVDAFATIPAMNFRRANGTAALPSALATDNIFFNLTAFGYGTSAYSGGGRVGALGYAAEAWTDTAQGSYLTFGTTAIGATAYTDRWKISDAGHLLPVANNAYTAGSSAFRLADIHTTNLTVYGICTGCGGASAAPFIDSTAIIKGSVDATKLLAFEVDAFTTATTRTLTPQDASYIIAGTNIAQTFSGANTFSVGQTFSSGFVLGGNVTTTSSGTISLGGSADRFSNIFTNAFTMYGSGLVQSGATMNFQAGATVNYNGSAGQSVTVTVRAAGGLADCTIIFNFGGKTGGTC